MVGPDQDRFERWIALLYDEIAVGEADDLFAKAAADLDAFLTSHPSARDELLAILARRLGEQVDERTWTTVEDALVKLVGRDVTYLLTWLVRDENQLPRLDAFGAFASRDALSALRTLLASYGPELDRALALATLPPEDWRSFAREVAFDQLNNRYQVKVRIMKYTGEWLVIDGSPNSILNLTRNFMWTLGSVPPESLAPKVVEDFWLDAQPVLDMLSTVLASTAPTGSAPPNGETSGGAPAGDATPNGVSTGGPPTGAAPPS